ncbi:hypothetical protein VUR80DRAFT_2648 [Thermomyces stellatus]
MQLAASGNLRVSLTGGQAYSNVPLDVVACILSTRERMILSSFPAPPPLSVDRLPGRRFSVGSLWPEGEAAQDHGGRDGRHRALEVPVSIRTACTMSMQGSIPAAVALWRPLCAQLERKGVGLVGCEIRDGARINRLGTYCRDDEKAGGQCG